MRFMMIVRATTDTEAGRFPDDCGLMHAMTQYHEQLARAGVLLDYAGLQPSAQGWQVRHAADGSQRIIDGPFAEAKELIAGYTLIQVRTRDEAMEWARRFPAPMGRGADAVLEVRRLYEADDLPRADATPQHAGVAARA